MGENLGGNAMARVIRDAAAEVVAGAASHPVLGSLDGSLNLKVDGFGPTIPRKDYHVIETKVKMYRWPSNLYTDDYRVELLLRPGDRVLCIPVEDGNTFVVVGQVK